MDSENTQTQLHESLESFFLFTAPEGAPPCEVYNFSLTATYVDATYPGADCSVTVLLSRMLPSLPSKKGLESSLNYSIEREGVNAISITVSLKVSNSYNDLKITVVRKYMINVHLFKLCTPGVFVTHLTYLRNA